MKVQFSFDDATIQDLDVAKLLLKYGYENNTVFYFPVMPNVVNTPKNRHSLTNKEMNSIADNFEIGSHTITHRLLTRISIDDARVEIIDSRKILQEKFNQNIDKFCYPRGYTNIELQSIVSEAGYNSARSTMIGSIYESENKFFIQTTVHVGYDRKEYGGKDWLTYAIYMVDLARNTKNSIFHAWGHGYELVNYSNGLQKFEQLLKYLKDSDET